MSSVIIVSQSVSLKGIDPGSITLAVVPAPDQTADILNVNDCLRVGADGSVYVCSPGPPPDGQPNPGEYASWVDGTPGASKIRFVARDQRNRIVNGEVPMG